MVFTQIPQVAELPDKALIYAIRGRVSKITKRFAGKNDDKPWSFQRFLLTHQGKSIRVVCKDRDPLEKSLEGQEVVILAHQSTKGWSSVYAFDDDFNNKVERCVKVTAQGEIVPESEYNPDAPRGQGGQGEEQQGDGDQNDQPPQRQQTRQSSRNAPQGDGRGTNTQTPPKGSAAGKPASAPPQNEPPNQTQKPPETKKPAPPDPIIAVRKAIGRLGVCYIYAFDAAIMVYDEVKRKHPGAPPVAMAEIQDLATSFVMGVTRDVNRGGFGMAEELPYIHPDVAARLEKEKAEAAAKTTPPPK